MKGKKMLTPLFLVCSPCSPKPVSLRKRVCSPYQPCWRRPSCPAAPAQLQCGHGKLHAEGRCTHPATSTQPPPATNLTNPRPPRPSSHTTITWLGAYMPLRPVIIIHPVASHTRPSSARSLSIVHHLRPWARTPPSWKGGAAHLCGHKQLGRPPGRLGEKNVSLNINKNNRDNKK